MTSSTNKIQILLATLVFAASPLFAHAATFSISLDKQAFPIGQEFTADIKMDTEGVGVNAAQGTISFSPDVLSISKTDTSNSVFNFWLQAPTFSNEAGKITFLGGSSNGFTGSSLEVFRVVFKVKGVGSSTITFTDGAITASDGSGTNVMRATKGVNITSATTGEITTIAPQPTQITRPPAVAAKLPAAPILSVSLYPDQQKWYNLSSDFTARWTLPSDVSEVATLINKDPRGIPPKSEGLFESKTFPALSDGIWYLHVQFKNNIGWGPMGHYRLAIDTVPPLPFTIKEDFGTSTDNPSPIITYESGDALSSVAYHILVDGSEIAVTTSTSYTLPPQTPGTHKIRVESHDKSDNITEGTADLTIIPIAPPTVSVVTRSVYANEGRIGLSGTAIPNSKILLALKNSAGNILADKSVDVDANGAWSTTFDKALGSGIYTVRVIASDARGAQSVPIDTPTISVKERPVLSLFGLSITQTGLIWFLIAILTLSFSGGYLLNTNLKKRRALRVLIAQRDVVNAFKTTKIDLAKAIEAFGDKKLTPEETTNLEFLLRRTMSSIEKAEKYITANISEIDK